MASDVLVSEAFSSRSPLDRDQLFDLLALLDRAGRDLVSMQVDSWHLFGWSA